jgi:hypothetical protein
MYYWSAAKRMAAASLLLALLWVLTLWATGSIA